MPDLKHFEILGNSYDYCKDMRHALADQGFTPTLYGCG